MSKRPLIFLSYRRADAPAVAQQISERLVGDYGEGTVFLDFESIPAGDRFPARIDTCIQQSAVLLVLMGDQWLALTKEKNREGHDPNSDWVRHEIETALAHNIAIVPVLTEFAKMPAKEELPTSIRSLCDLNAAEVRPGVHFWRELEMLSESIETFLEAHTPGLGRKLHKPATVVSRRVEEEWDLFQFHGGIFASLAVDSSDSDRIYAISVEIHGGRGLYESGDGGTSWRRIVVPLLRGDPNRVYANENEILLATDGAALSYDRKRNSWQRIDLPGLSNDYLFITPLPESSHELTWGTLKPGGATAGSATVAVASDDGVSEFFRLDEQPGGLGIRRNDGRDTFAPFQVNDVAFVPGDSNRFVAAAPNEDQLLLVDIQRGTYHHINGFCGKKPLRVLFSRFGNLIYVAGLDGLWKADVGSCEIVDCKFQHVIDQDSDTACLAEGFHDIYYGSSRGLYWSEHALSTFRRYPIQPPLTHINAIVPCDKGLLVATGGAGVFRLSPQTNNCKCVLTAGGGMPIFHVLDSEAFTLVNAFKSLYRCSADELDAELVHSFPGNVTRMICLHADEPFGEHEAPPYFSRSAASRASAAYQGATILAGSQGLFRKSAGSSTWTEVEGAGSGVVNEIIQSPLNRRQVYAIVGGRLIRSYNQGETWTEVHLGRPIYCVSLIVERDGSVLLSGQDGRNGLMLRAENDRKEFTIVTELGSEQFATAMCLWDGSILAALTNGRILRWNNQTFDDVGRIPIEQSEWIDLASAVDGRIYASVKEGVVFVSSDGGRNWKNHSIDSMLKGSDLQIFGTGLDKRGLPMFYSTRGLARCKIAPVTSIS